ncbi:hypothetical protein C3K47_17110 [Solitalea longa]|uniref:Uncharacterized protein n=1 Tax=Solitalea longa TaxID=2079460 RepID=A0A2S4ZYJ7_9SPHI|nr:hypothetical protein [Solitalea longa]POY35119.1 hypothetical protein C3K47_17110 [Solitalea longa]
MNNWKTTNIDLKVRVDFPDSAGISIINGRKCFYNKNDHCVFLVGTSDMPSKLKSSTSEYLENFILGVLDNDKGELVYKKDFSNGIIKGKDISYKAIRKFMGNTPIICKARLFAYKGIVYFFASWYHKENEKNSEAETQKFFNSIQLIKE